MKIVNTKQFPEDSAHRALEASRRMKQKISGQKVGGFNMEFLEPKIIYQEEINGARKMFYVTDFVSRGVKVIADMKASPEEKAVVKAWKTATKRFLSKTDLVDLATYNAFYDPTRTTIYFFDPTLAHYSEKVRRF